jgi:hypothetical protein
MLADGRLGLGITDGGTIFNFGHLDEQDRTNCFGY